MGTKEPLHLIPKPPAYGAAIVVDTYTPHEVGQRTPEDELAVLRPYRFGADPRQQQARQVTVRQFVSASGHHVERKWPITPDVLFLVAVVGARQTAQRK